MSEKSKYISPSELAARWGISASAVYDRKCGTNRLTPHRFGRVLRFLRSEVEAFEEELFRGAKKLMHYPGS